MCARNHILQYIRRSTFFLKSKANINCSTVSKNNKSFLTALIHSNLMVKNSALYAKLHQRRPSVKELSNFNTSRRFGFVRLYAYYVVRWGHSKPKFKLAHNHGCIVKYAPICRTIYVCVYFMLAGIIIDPLIFKLTTMLHQSSVNKAHRP
jgi:hypothetical protein